MSSTSTIRLTKGKDFFASVEIKKSYDNVQKLTGITIIVCPLMFQEVLNPEETFMVHKIEITDQNYERIINKSTMTFDNLIFFIASRLKNPRCDVSFGYYLENNLILNLPLMTIDNINFSQQITLAPDNDYYTADAKNLHIKNYQYELLKLRSMKTLMIDSVKTLSLYSDLEVNFNLASEIVVPPAKPVLIVEQPSKAKIGITGINFTDGKK